MGPMQAVAYRIVLEGIAPEADEARVRAFLQRVRSREDLQEPILENFPLELPGRFDFRRASEWLEALARAGIRGRVDVVTAADDETTGGFSIDWAGHVQWPANPWALWVAMWTRPTQIFTLLRAGVPAHVLLFGLALAALGSVLALPGDVQLMTSGFLGLQVAAPWRLWLGTVIAGPLSSMAVWTLLTVLLLRILRVPAQWVTVLGIVALAQVAAPLAALPLGGGALVVGTTLWFLGVGCAAVYDLEAGKVAGLYLVPAALALVPLFVVVNAAILLLGNVDTSGMLSGMSWRWPR